MNKPVSIREAPAELARPSARLVGPVDDDFLRAFIERLEAAEEGEGPFVLELTTTGGDADVGRRISADLRLFRERTGRRTIVFGKSVVYSAGATILAGVPRQDRWLARETTLLIHCRSLNRTLELSGPLAVERPKLEALIAEIDVGLDVEEEGFRQFIAGSEVGLPELLERAQSGWYIDAEEAFRRGLVGGLV